MIGATPPQALHTFTAWAGASLFLTLQHIT